MSNGWVHVKLLFTWKKKRKIKYQKMNLLMSNAYFRDRWDEQWCSRCPGSAFSIWGWDWEEVNCKMFRNSKIGVEFIIALRVEYWHSTWQLSSSSIPMGNIYCQTPLHRFLALLLSAINRLSLTKQATHVTICVSDNRQWSFPARLRTINIPGEWERRYS